MPMQTLKILRAKVLSDCKPSDAFWVCTGEVVRNLYELARAVEAMGLDPFVYHVNDDNKKNDFARWIKEVLDDEELSRRLQKVKIKSMYAEIIRDRIAELESAG